MYARFGLILMVNHACNLRCGYCYTGAKFGRSLPGHFGRAAIDRALRSLEPGGTLELGFFGGEPLVEAEQILGWMHYARSRAKGAGRQLQCGLTTNGTLVEGAAWSVLTDPGLNLAISHDGLPEVHDAQRVTVDGHGSSAQVLKTVDRLRAAGREFRVVMVVRPDNAEQLPAGLRYLRSRGVWQFDLSLDLWARWERADAARLKRVIAACAELWADWLPIASINWFDEKAAELTAVPCQPTARCGFGAGEVAVAPSGRLYPCERVIGEDDPASPLRLPGDVMAGEDFLWFEPGAARSAPQCDVCSLAEMCNSTCSCSNYIRTGRSDRPDGLLCLVNQCCVDETARALARRGVAVPALN